MQWNSGAIHEAIGTAKAQKKIFLVYIEGTDDASKNMTEVFNSSNVVEALGDDCIPVKLQANSVEYLQFHQIYPILIVPSTFFIGVTGIPLEVAAGALEQNEFIAKIEKAKLLHQQSTLGNAENVTPNVTNQISNGESSIMEESSESEKSPVAADEQPSTSSASELPIEDRVERAKQLLAEKKMQRMKEEQEEERRKEVEYRKTGKEMRRAKLTREEKEMEEWAQTRKKEREEEKLAKERVRQQIAQDRAERAARSAMTSVQPTKTSDQASKSNQGPIDFQGNCIRIQLRRPDGSSTTQEFPTTATLADVQRFVIQDMRPSFSRFSLATTFPRRQFQQEDYSETLVSLGLAPSAVLLLVPEKSLSLPRPQGPFWSILSTMFSPVMAVWSFVLSFFTRSRPNPSNGTNQRTGTSRSNETGESGRPQTARRRQNARNDAPYRREGNIHRFSNDGHESDDENNTWNGNSTQQL